MFLSIEETSFLKSDSVLMYLVTSLKYHSANGGKKYNGQHVSLTDRWIHGLSPSLSINNPCLRAAMEIQFLLKIMLCLCPPTN